MRTKHKAPANLAVTHTSSGTSPKVGRLVPGSKPGALVVDFDGNTAGPLPARAVVTLSETAVQHAIASRQSVVLLFENDDVRLPIVMGLVAADQGATLLGALLQQAPTAETSPVPVDARVDGKRVIVEGEHEVLLRCGDASITLRPDGKVIVRGAYIETTATGVNRIRGGSVKIN
jgi:hypothetical protein